MKNTIKTLNKRASQILADLIEKCESGEGYAKIDNGGKGIMAAGIATIEACIEKLRAAIAKATV